MLCVHLFVEYDFNKVVDILPVVGFPQDFDVLADELEADVLQSLSVVEDGLAEEVGDVGQGKGLDHQVFASGQQAFHRELVGGRKLKGKTEQFIANCRVTGNII